MNRKITTSDISLALGLSRNTVSKALNGHPSITVETRKKVVDHAIAMGYKKLKPSAASGTAAESVGKARSIAYITKSQINHGTGFWMNVLSGVEQMISQNGYEMKLSFIKNEDIEALELPALLASDIAGFIVAGSFDKPYTEKLMALPHPKVFINVHPHIPLPGLQADVVFMENEDSIYQITRHLMNHGHTEIGFIGEIQSCRSFMERWFGFQRAHFDANLLIQPSLCITSQNAESYQNYEGIARSLKALSKLPTAFVCANDKIALHVIKYLYEIGKSVPRDLAVTGFDQISEAEFLGFTLTTVALDEYQLGQRATEQLLTRMSKPNRAFETVRLAADVVIGESSSPRQQ
ncbi:LacI family DNA-binding transcriptional regulator [Paenibacillus sp. CF384]|uniref:LacI family DNA-binding transcriptional regulator n=1 Tax=Paenibacillus sp. CF384 TaxID=1884382 RepID=UPI00089D1E90|nr:LacI family DNA-binding transcriptional regulator [Paenibacillus sp. CF384]SDX46694.1 transcriptional regulator, LacI family [Paenibacillus sp. CF384]